MNIYMNTYSQKQSYRKCSKYEWIYFCAFVFVYFVMMLYVFLMDPSLTIKI